MVCSHISVTEQMFTLSADSADKYSAKDVERKQKCGSDCLGFFSSIPPHLDCCCVNIMDENLLEKNDKL